LPRFCACCDPKRVKPSFDVPALRSPETAGLGFDVWFREPAAGTSLTVGRIEPDPFCARNVSPLCTGEKWLFV